MVFTRLLAPAAFLPRFPGFASGFASGIASQCAVCRSWPARQVCGPCMARFASPAQRCMRCALALPADLSMGLRTGPPLCGACAIDPPPLDRTFAGVAYAYPWSTLIAGYKFGEQHGWAAFFAGLLLQSPGLALVLGELAPEDWLLPVPLSTQRLEARGFNQAWELCAALARQTRTQAGLDARLLLRVKHTRPQSQLKRKERLANVKGAFQVDPLRTAELQGRRVVLVDDVMTSGASLYTAAQALRDAGAAHVTAVVLARTAPA
jgi:ComF family protein